MLDQMWLLDPEICKLLVLGVLDKLDLRKCLLHDEFVFVNTRH